MKKGTINFLKGTIFIIAIATLFLCLFWLPQQAESAAQSAPEFASLKYPVLFGLYATVVPFFLALYQAYKLLDLIADRRAFSESSAAALGRIKSSAFAIMLIYIAGMVMLGMMSALHPGIALVGLVILFAALTIAIFTAVLQTLLKDALKLKSEHDLTI
ncbi:DUF2975 domain-containing protein [Jeotgalibacillus campisalis]|uniref:Membrane protein n=1 Tax=Jeotgalibacillus campisalis TaxID=220754 RepID=A0A0C2RLE0_9BACL|nr:DUF2975 domain-containing protein [Jeotgalibacillus campisalis]KIL51045.1 membrane protein [Jeotgalibacillus campisalis]